MAAGQGGQSTHSVRGFAQKRREQNNRSGASRLRLEEQLLTVKSARVLHPCAAVPFSETGACAAIGSR